MPKVVRSAKNMISGMTPKLIEGDFVFARSDKPKMAETLSARAIATMREAEGLSLILPAEIATGADFETSPAMKCITLNVYSSLEGVGLTAAVSAALAANDIPCNMVAGYYHDHVFVPSDKADQALAVLKALQE